jgi:hypothetical protein
MTRSEQHLASITLAASAAFALIACTDRELKPLQPCLVSALSHEVVASGVTAVDLLFVVDNSHSMTEEQASLRREFPKLIEVLTSGERPGHPPFTPVKDLHLAVVSSDMGLVGIDGIPGCTGLGDDGVMREAPDAPTAGCETTYPRFLTYLEGAHDPAATARDFACVSALGIDGCGFEQPLEAALKALWPSTDERVRFLGDAMGFGRVGHGDTDNAGFLRGQDAARGSLLAVIVVSDEEDCSSRDTRHLVPEPYLPEDSPLRAQDLNLRCFHNPGNLYPIDRYVDALRALRPGQANRVVFGAIVGVPPDLVDAAARTAVDFGDAAARDAYYAGVLGDPRMQEIPDPTRPPGEGNLTPSCTTDHGVAYPPRRVVEVARRFGEAGLVQSICEDDFGPAMDAVLSVLVDRLTVACLPRPLVRDAEGRVGCDVVWELPPPGTAAPGTPAECADRPYLAAPESHATTADGGAVCTVRQIPVTAGAVQRGAGQTEGWYYDDFSPEVARDCSSATPQRVAFTDGAQPSAGVKVKLTCLDEAPHVASTRTDLAPGIRQPAIGDACDEDATGASGVAGDAACEVTLANGTQDASMFCHPEWNVCVRGCATDADCPPAWVCDASDATRLSATRALCVNPTCGELR